MALEWTSTCKDCGEKFGYSDSSYQLGNQRGLSRPERCPKCRYLHTREIGTLGLSHFELTPIRPIPADGLKPAELGGLARPKRVHDQKEKPPKFDFNKFAIKDEHIWEYFTILQRHQITVIVAPTGSGKSTLLPYRLMMPPTGLPENLLTRHGQIIITQPRIQATRNIPAFVAEELHGSSLGAGYDVGFRHSGSPATDWRNKLVYMTDGSLINMIVRNELGRVSVIMIDEAHERSLNIDLILGLLKTQLPRYPHLKLIIASATINTQLFLEYYGGPKGFNPDTHKNTTDEGDFYDNQAIAQTLMTSPVGFYGFPGKRQHPVETRYRADNPIPETQMSGRMPEEVADKAVEILLAMEEGTEKARGDILAFLQGEKPIEQAVAGILERIETNYRLAGKVDVLPLYTTLPQHQQDFALKPKKNKNRLRVVISTNVAETSLTVEGIVHVIDSGLINEAQWDPKTQTTYVLPKLHSQAGCKQRWGRAGRVQAGIAHCLYTETQFKNFPAYTEPEITRSPLDQIVLTAKAAGVDDISQFDWIQRPSEAELARTPQALKQMGALDAQGDLTDHGLELRSTAEELDFANLMILADRFGCAIEMASLLAMQKQGGYTQFLLWDKAWDAPTKQAVHRIHLGLQGPCLDDVEFYLKLWAAWETAGEQRNLWADRYFVNGKLLNIAATEREAMLQGISGHKKDNQTRSIDFDLLWRLRIVITYGLPNRVYQLTNPAPHGQSMNEDASYTSYMADPLASPELIELHANAKVEIDPSSVCFGQFPAHFVCGVRRRIRRRTSPQKDPETIITAAFLTLIKPEWLQCIGKPAVFVARLLAAETRSATGDLLRTTLPARLRIDQTYPLGTTWIYTSDDHVFGKLTETKNTEAYPPRLLTGKSYEDIQAYDGLEILTAEKQLNPKAGLRNMPVILAPDEEAETPLWTDMVDDGDEEEASPMVLHIPTPEKLTLPAKLRKASLPTNQPTEVVVVGYDLSEEQSAKVIVEILPTPTQFELFAQKYKIGQDIQVVVREIETYVHDFLAYLIVYELETGLEIVLDPYDASLIGRNFAFLMLQPGNKLSATIEVIDHTAKRVRVTRLRASEAAIRTLMGTNKERIVDAQIMDVSDIGLFVWLDPMNTADYTPCAAFAHLKQLPIRPDEMALGQSCKVKITPRQLKKRPLTRTIKLQNDFIGKLQNHHWPKDFQWDGLHQTLTLNRPMTYGERLVLLGLISDGEWQRAINLLFRRSNELEVRIIDMTGIQELVPYQQTQQPVKGKILRVTDYEVIVSLPNGFEARVSKQDALYDSTAKLTDHFKEGNTYDTRVKTIDLEQGKADLTLRRPEDNPLRDYNTGQIVYGTVSKILTDGVLIQLSHGVYGKVFKDNLSWRRIEDISKFFPVGQRVTAQIVTVDLGKSHMTLTLRLPENDPIKKYALNQRTQGVVVGFAKDSGAFVELEPGVEGYLHINEASVSNTDNIRKVLTQNQQVFVRITEINYTERRLRVTIRGLYESELQLPLSHIRLVIGRGGTTIKEIMSTTQTAIQVDDDGACLIQGMAEIAIQQATQRIKDILKTRIVTLHISQAQIPLLIGKGGATIKGLNQPTVQVEHSDGIVTIIASDNRSLQNTIEKIREVISYCNAVIEVPTGMMGRLIGPQGTNIKRIQAETYVFINTPRDNSGRVEIKGQSRQAVEQAVQQIQYAVGNVNYITFDEQVLPPVMDVPASQPLVPRPRKSVSQTPILSRSTPTPTPPHSVPITVPPTSHPRQFSAQLSVTADGLQKLMRKQSGLLGWLFGGGQSALEKIQLATGTQIQVNSASGIVTIVGKTQATVNQAMSQIRNSI